jgi:integrase
MAKVAFTAGRVNGFKCRADKAQAFLWDETTPGLGLRATPNGRLAFVFQGVYRGKDVRLTIGSPAAWSIPKAREKARELQRLIDEGQDPRDLKRRALAEHAAATAQSVTVGEAWTAYLAARRPHWGDRHYADHQLLGRAGGEKAARGTRGRGVTIAGPIHPLLVTPLRALDATAIEAWAAQQAKTRPTQARLAWRCLKAFLGWCAEQPEYAPVVPKVNPAKTKKAREVLGNQGIKQDALMREQLAAWFDAVRNISNPVTAAYLQTVLLTGARPGEVLALRWEDINLQWRGLTIRDKVEGVRVIPLTPYVSQLLHALPRRKDKEGKPLPWVFSSATAPDGKLTIPRSPHVAACAVAGIQGLTLHGLRRSFKSLTEWLEIPAGVVAQIMGHKPSATAEKHYTVRPLDLLRIHHERIEAWILEQAGVPFVADVGPGKLRAVR